MLFVFFSAIICSVKTDDLHRSLSRISATQEQLARERESEFLKELLKTRPEVRWATIQKEPKFRTQSLARCLLKESEVSLWFNPGTSLQLARLACAIISGLAPGSCGGVTSHADLHALGVATEGNVQRVRGRLDAAISAFACSRDIATRGGSEKGLTARINLMEASLRRDVGQLHCALELLTLAEEEFSVLGDEEGLTQAQINRSNVFQVQEDYDEANFILEELDGRPTSPSLRLCIRHNLIHSLARAGRPCDAAYLLASSRDLYRFGPGSLIRSRRLWVEGIIACGLGEDRLARNFLGKAGLNLQSSGYSFDAALAHLDLGKILAQGDSEARYVS